MSMRWIAYNEARYNFLNGVIKLGKDRFKMVLLSPEYVPNAESHSQYDDLSFELETANGYGKGGAMMANTRLVRSTDTVEFTADDQIFTATKGDIGPYRYAVIYSESSDGKKLLCYTNLGRPLTIVQGSKGQIVTPENGILQFKGGCN